MEWLLGAALNHHQHERESLVVASANPHKLEEFRRMLQPLGISVLSAEEAGFHDIIEENASTFRGNAQIKAETIFKAVGRATIADDSGLAVDALNGEPGVRSARYGGDGLDDAGRRALLLKNMEGITRRSARFVAVIALTDGGGTTFFEGVSEGTILHEERGEGGFGYDPLFAEPESGRTFAELTGEEKDRISHRGRAVDKLVQELTKRKNS